MGFRSVPGRGLARDSRLTSQARSGHQLAARTTVLARSAVLVLPAGQNDNSLGRHLGVLANHCAPSGTLLEQN